MAGKRVGLAIASGLLTLLGTISPKSDLETIVAQDAKPVAEVKEEQPDTYKKIAEYFTNSATEFYTKAKDTNKTKEAANLALIFDSENQTAKDLIQKAEKNKLKTNNKELKKAEENYSKNKEKAINELYNNAIQKIQTDKKEALKILDEIWKIDEKNEKPLEVRKTHLDWKETDGGYLVPKFIWEQRELGKKYLNEAGEGEKYETEDELEAVLKFEKVHKRKSDWVIARSLISEEDAKRIHKVGEAGIKYISKRMGIEEWPFLPTAEEKKIMKEQGVEKKLFRVTQFDSPDAFDKYCKDFIEDKTVRSNPWNRYREDWEPYSKTKDKPQKIHTGQIHHGNNVELRDDNLVHLVSQQARVDNSNTSRTGWIHHGFDYLMTIELLGTTKYNEVGPIESKYKNDDGNGFTYSSGSAYVRKTAYDSMLKNEGSSFEGIIRIDDEDKFSPKDVALAVSINEFLLERYPEKILTLLTDRRDKTHRWYNKKNLEAFKEAFGKEAHEFNEEYRQWVLENYVGYRQVKN